MVSFNEDADESVICGTHCGRDDDEKCKMHEVDLKFIRLNE